MIALRLRCLSVLALALVSANVDARDGTAGEDLIVVQGAGGNEEYEAAFGECVKAWKELASSSDMSLQVIGGGEGNPSDREALRLQIEKLSGEDSRRAWFVFIGHGTFFNNEAKFNLDGPDVSARELAHWLQPLKQPIAVINCSSSSGAFIERLSGPNRVIITATRSGAEYNFSRFGTYLAEAIKQQAADVDHDGSVSLLEAFLAASRSTGAFYRDQQRLVTEHALLDDNGDAVGTSADFFRGIQIVRRPEGVHEVDGMLAHRWMISRFSKVTPLTDALRQQRDDVEEAIQALRLRKSSMDTDEYYGQLETLMVRLARIYHPHEEGDSTALPPQPPASPK